MRTEKDSLGEVEVPSHRLWGAQTQRSLQHFAISDERMPIPVIYALAFIKWACAIVHAEMAIIDRDKAHAIASAAQEVLSGQHDDEFPLRVWQTGSGTQTNMNMNEVLANRASELLGGPRGQQRWLHPNDDINRSQSSNDVFSTAMHIAAITTISQQLVPTLAELRQALAQKSAEFFPIIKVGRTHLQDAVPLRLGQEFSGYATQLATAENYLGTALPALYPVALGGSAVGTGLNTPPGFSARSTAILAELTELPLTPAENKFAVLAAHDALVYAHGALKSLAASLHKIANDIRWLASGPRAGLGELRLPANEPGSSIMPGKINPTQCEAVIMVCQQVFGNDVAIAMAGAAGNFELNVCKPVLIANFLRSARLLTDAMRSFTRYCVTGIEANELRIASLVEASMVQVTALTPYIGYDRSAQIAEKSRREHISIRDAALGSGVSNEDFERWTNLENLIGK